MLKKLLSENIRGDEDEGGNEVSTTKSASIPAAKSRDVQAECLKLKKENLRLQEELLLRSSDVYQLIIRTAKVNYRMKTRGRQGETTAPDSGDRVTNPQIMKKDMSVPGNHPCRTADNSSNYELGGEVRRTGTGTAGRAGAATGP